VTSGRLDQDAIREIEWRDSVFQEIDYRVYA
jgi:predicted glycosyl hydrolase (DUF1957 family)